VLARRVASALAVVVLLWLGPDAGIPNRALLASATGQVAWIESHKYGVKFRFKGALRLFDYPSKARGNGLVLDALSSAATQAVAIALPSENLFMFFRPSGVFSMRRGSIGACR